MFDVGFFYFIIMNKIIEWYHYHLFFLNQVVNTQKIVRIPLYKNKYNYKTHIIVSMQLIKNHIIVYIRHL